MTLRAAIHQLMCELPAMLELQQVSACEERDAWLVAINAEDQFDLEYDVKLNRLIVTGDIGIPVDHARLAIYEILLQYNLLWQDTGGVCMALEIASGRLVMMLHLPASDLHVLRLTTVLANMSSIRAAWRQILRDIADTSNSQAAPTHVHAHIGCSAFSVKV